MHADKRRFGPAARTRSSSVLLFHSPVFCALYPAVQASFLPQNQRFEKKFEILPFFRQHFAPLNRFS
jgi:hypothetical protein